MSSENVVISFGHLTYRGPIPWEWAAHPYAGRAFWYLTWIAMAETWCIALLAFDMSGQLSFFSEWKTTAWFMVWGANLVLDGAYFLEKGPLLIWITSWGRRSGRIPGRPLS